MNFDLSEDQRALLDSVEKFAKSATRRRPAPSPDAPADGATARWRQMAELGLTGLIIAEDCGGLGLTVAEIVLVCEGLGQSLAQEPFTTGAIVAAKLLELCSSDSLRAAHLQAISEGRMRIAPALQESIADFDLETVSATCDDRSGRLRVDGRKELVIDGLAATHFAVTARSAKHGLNAFLVAADQPGVTVAPIRGLDGGRLARVTFDAAVVEDDAPLFGPDSGLSNVECALDFGSVALCAEALGLMNRMLALTASYLTTRHQFGKPIGTFQALQHRFADMVIAAEQSRSATFMAAAALTGDDPLVRMSEVSAAKSTVCRHGRVVVEGAIQLHGGIGITNEYELSRYVRRMLEIEKTWGDRQHHEARFAKSGG